MQNPRKIHEQRIERGDIPRDGLGIAEVDLLIIDFETRVSDLRNECLRQISKLPIEIAIESVRNNNRNGVFSTSKSFKRAYSLLAQLNVAMIGLSKLKNRKIKLVLFSSQK